jgi:dipeptidyl aminopeptidase/acylaminoacyl peptidase
VRNLDVRFASNEPPMVWVDGDRLALIAWDIGAEKSGALYFRILRGPNSAAQWKRALEGRVPSVSVLESGKPEAEDPSGRLVVLDLRTNARATLARGNIHRLSVSTDGRLITFLRERPGTPLASYFEFGSDVEKAYAAVNWGTEREVIDARSGAKVDASSIPIETPKPEPRIDSTIPPLGPDARRLSATPSGDAALYVATIADGTHLWLCGGGGRPMSTCSEIWRANEWMRAIKTGRAESITYNATDGTPLTAWLLLPEDHLAGTKLPLITYVYPGTVYSSRPPSSFSLFRTDFNHPQLFAALGYAVLLPSMPEPKDPADAHTLNLLPNGVLPAIDAVIARGIADPDRIGLIGQSDGGFATIGLITQTTRFRSAIASAGFSNLFSLYGTFFGQNRYGDSGPPQKGQQLRVLQMEKGLFALGGPPWGKADLYRAGSPIFSADKVQTPLMLIHGDLDYIPIQQDEEFFTALFRQDKRVRFVRYHGEWHTIANRSNVLDLWQRIADWLSETMAVRNQNRL